MSFMITKNIIYYAQAHSFRPQRAIVGEQINIVFILEFYSLQDTLEDYIV